MKKNSKSVLQIPESKKTTIMAITKLADVGSYD